MLMPSRWIPLFKPHPSRRELLRRQSGELPKRRQAELNRHLADCEECRQYVESTEISIEAYRSAMEDSGGRSDRMARRFALGLDAADREMQAERQTRGTLSGIPRPVWVGAAATLTLAAVVYFQFSRPPVAQASEVVERAVRAETGRRQSDVRRIEIRSRQHRVVREFSGSSAAASTVTADAQLLAAELQTISLKWDDPLSARDFQVWRSGLAQETDKVTSDDATISVTTAALGKATQERTLVVRKLDWHAVRQTITIPGDTIEIEELAALPMTRPKAVEVTGLGAAPVADAIPAGAPEPVTAKASQGIRERQVEAWTILHRLQADVNEQLAADLKGDEIEVTGVVETSNRKHQLVDALSTIEELQFAVHAADEADASPARAGQEVIVSASAARPPLLEDWLHTNFTDREERSNFTARAFGLSVGLSKRASAMAHLATQFPQQVSERLSPHAAEELRQLAGDFAQGIREGRVELAEHLAPISNVEGGSTVEGAGWQCEARAWSEASRSVGRALALLLTSHDVTDVDEKGAREMLRTGLEGLKDGACRSTNR